MTDIAQSVSFKDISVQRKLPIINGFVQAPDGQTPREKTSIGSGRGFQLNLRNSLTTEDAEVVVPGSFTRQISGNLRTDREWYILPEFNPLVGPPSDFFADLRNLIVNSTLISFSCPEATCRIIADPSLGNIFADIALGDKITVSGSVLNDGTFVVTDPDPTPFVPGDQLGFAAASGIVPEAAGALITLTVAPC